eukprot:Selendium_serpulae@DN5610_c0_g1_i3.p2
MHMDLKHPMTDKQANELNIAGNSDFNGPGSGSTPLMGNTEDNNVDLMGGDLGADDGEGDSADTTAGGGTPTGIQRSPISNLEPKDCEARGTTLFICNKIGCGNTFTRRSNLQAHIRAVHIAVKQFKCSECGTCFGYKGALKRHLMTTHGINLVNALRLSGTRATGGDLVASSPMENTNGINVDDEVEGSRAEKDEAAIAIEESALKDLNETEDEFSKFINQAFPDGMKLS